MKKIFYLVTIFISALFLVSCSDTSAQENGNSTSVFNVVGTPLAHEQLENFEFDYQVKKELIDYDTIVDFLDSLDNSEFKELYYKALSLVQLIDTVGFEISDNVDASDKTYIEVKKYGKDYLHTYYETGYTYDSFYSAYCEVFTKETAEKTISHYPAFYEYNGELWYSVGSGSGNPREVLREYEIVSQTDTALEFRRISYQNDANNDDEEYDPEKRDEYLKEYIDFKFVLTENGWRVEKFLNAENPDESMLFS